MNSTVVAGNILIVEVFSEHREASTSAIKFGGSNLAALTGPEYSMLDADGRLPQNKTGFLSAVMIDSYQAVGTQAENQVNAFHVWAARHRVRVDIYVGNVIVAQHRLGVLPAPGFVGTIGTTTADETQQIGNGGWPCAFGEHELLERQSLRVDFVPAGTLPSVTDNQVFWTVDWQVKTRTPYSSRA